MIETLARAVTIVAQMWAPFTPVQQPSGLAQKVIDGICWREGCWEKETSSLGLCAPHLEEARKW